jgi:hypothetical protein
LFADIFNHEIHQKHETDAGDLWNSSLRFFVWFVYFVVNPFPRRAGLPIAASRRVATKKQMMKYE